MAVRNIAVTDTIEKFRTEFNALCATDFGDIANLDASLSATNLIEAMNETLVAATNTAGFRVEDSSSSQQLIAGGDTLKVLGTSSEIEAVVSATDTLTIGLPNAVSITTSLTAPTLSTGNLSLSNASITDSSGAISFGNENLSTTGTFGSGNITSSGNISGVNITGSGTTHTLGTVEISGNTIRSTDSTRININDTFRANTFETQTGLMSIDETSGFPRISSSRGDDILVFNAIPAFQGSSIIFEGATADAHETTISVTDPTADRTITFADESGTVLTTGGADIITEAMMANDAIGQNELKSVVTLQILNSSGTPLKTLFAAGA
tara:strand:- start:6590 stop:7561 length:972 start_codon:yes stop_codon:yes gene_type:complete